MAPSKTYERIGSWMMADLGRNIRHHPGHVAGVGIFDRGMRLRVDEYSS
jgi:hypothetical protein